MRSDDTLTGGLWVSHPDEVEALVRQWEREQPGLLSVEHSTQFSGRPVWSLTVTDAETEAGPKRKALIFKPHAHEPASISAQMNVLSQLLTGQTLDGRKTELPRERLLAETLVCFQPDANPTGTAAAPVPAWDGTQYTNEEFIGWMLGVDPQTGKPWKRVDLWDETKETNLPPRYGIVYEQVSEHEYVEPNRHPRSTLMQWLARMRERYTWDRLLDLHQTEFPGSDRNCMVILPAGFNDQPAERQEIERVWAAAVIEAWMQLPFGRPLSPAEPLSYTGEQLQYFLTVFGEIYQTNNLITIEVQNNSLLTPPPLQQRLAEVAIETTLLGLLA